MKQGTRIACIVAAALVAGCGGGGAGDGNEGPAAALGTSTTRTVPAWTVDAPFENNPGKAEYPSVAIAAGGDTVTVFAQQSGTRRAVFAVHGNVDSATSGTPRQIDHPETNAQASQRANGKFLSATQVAMNPVTGDAIAVWNASANGQPQIWTARYARAADRWSAPARLDASPSGATAPVVAMNAQGRAVAAWSESGAVVATVSSIADMSAAGAWQPPLRLSSGPAGMPQAGIDAAGNALIAWTERDASGIDGIHVSRIAPTGSATPARRLDTLQTSASMPSVAVAPGGSALIAWLQEDGNGNSVHVSRFDGHVWSTARVVESQAGSSFAPFAALNDAGGFVAWEQEVADAASGSAYAARVDATGTWHAPVNVYNRGGFMPVVRLRDNGDAMMIWLAAHTQFATWSAASGNWSSVVNLAPYNCGAGHALAVDAASGKAIAAWIPSNCARNNDVYGAFYR